MSNLIMEALAFNHGRAAGINVEESNNTADNYVESAIVSLASAKRENPDCEVSLYCNDPLSGCYVDIAKRLGIGIKAVPFDNYVFLIRNFLGTWHITSCARSSMLSTRAMRPYVSWILTRGARGRFQSCLIVGGGLHDRA